MFRLPLATLNPEQLYGKVVDDKWHDGLLVYVWRNALSCTEENKTIIFDDEVGVAELLESMNTVLDDNKKKCMSSNDILELHQSMKVVFEVANVEGSPAFVSRCGSVYIDHGTIDHDPNQKVARGVRLPDVDKHTA